MRRKLCALMGGALFVVFSVGVSANEDPIHHAQELRQAAMILIGNDFGYMNAMLKGEVPWSDQQFVERGRELGAIGQLNLLRGFVADSYEGETRAKPDIELEFDEFSDKMHKFESALQKFGAAADAAAMKTQFKDLGENCKGCHKKYKSKEIQGD